MSLLGCLVALIAVTAMSVHAHRKAIRIADALMEPQQFARGYHRSVPFEPLGLRWTVWYVSRELYVPTTTVSVDLLGRVNYTSKYFVDRAMELATH